MSDKKEKPYVLHGYYIAFTPTGVPAVDKILSAVARAAKAYHSTEYWTDEIEPYDERFTGATCEDWIQNAANECADRLRVEAATPVKENEK